jgi:AraC-like DNA-binding protein
MSYYERIADADHYCYFRYQYAPNAESHFHNAVELFFVHEGCQEVVVSGEKRLLQKGDACFCDTLCAHAYRGMHLTDETPALCSVVVGDKTFFARAFSLLGDKTPPPFFRFENFDLLQILYAQWENAKNNPLVAPAFFEGCVQILLGEIAKNTQFVSREKDKQDELLCNLLLYAEQHLQDDLSLSVLAKEFGYSREHISRLLHKYLLENWQQYVNRLRVREADALLRKNPSENVLSVALSCGFDSANTFYRAYKKEFGYPPRKRIK